MSAIKESLLLPLWTEVGRHAHLHESLPVIVLRLLDVLPLAGIRFDEVLAAEGELQVLAEWTAHGGLDRSHRTSGYNSADLQDLLRWARSGIPEVFEPGDAVAGAGATAGRPARSMRLSCWRR